MFSMRTRLGVKTWKTEQLHLPWKFNERHLKRENISKGRDSHHFSGGQAVSFVGWVTGQYEPLTGYKWSLKKPY